MRVYILYNGIEEIASLMYRFLKWRVNGRVSDIFIARNMSLMHLRLFLGTELH